MTVRRYLEILEGTFMIRLLQPWHVNLGRRLVKRPKLHLRDSGLFHSLLAIDSLPQLGTHKKLGASWEGFALETAIRAIGKRSEELSGLARVWPFIETKRLLRLSAITTPSATSRSSPPPTSSPPPSSIFRPKASKRYAIHKRTMAPIEPPWQAIKEWIPDDEPDLDWFNRPRNPSNPGPDGFDQRPSWQPEEVPLEDGRILILDDT